MTNEEKDEAVRSFIRSLLDKLYGFDYIGKATAVFVDALDTIQTSFEMEGKERKLCKKKK